MGPGAGTGLGTHLVGTLHARFSNAEPQSRCALPNESAIGDNNRQSHLPDGAAARAPGAIRGRNSQPRDVDRRGPTVIVPAVAPDGDLPIGLSGPSTRKSRDTRSGLTILVEHGLDTLQVGILRGSLAQGRVQLRQPVSRCASLRGQHRLPSVSRVATRFVPLPLPRCRQGRSLRASYRYEHTSKRRTAPRQAV